MGWLRRIFRASRWLSLLVALLVVAAYGTINAGAGAGPDGARPGAWAADPRPWAAAFLAAMVLGVAADYRNFYWRFTWFLVATAAASAGFQDDWLQWGLMWSLIVALLVIYRKFLGKLAIYVLSHPTQAVLLAVYFLVLYGKAGTDSMGFPNLFWYETAVGRFLGAFSSVLLLAVLGTNAYFLDDNYARNQVAIREFLGRNQFDYATLLREDGWFGWLRRRLVWLDPVAPRPEHAIVAQQVTAFLRLARLPFLMLVALPALYPLEFSNVPRLAPIRGLPPAPIHLLTARPTIAGRPIPAFRPDVGRDPRAWLIGVLLWISGLLAGVMAVKLAVKISVLTRGDEGPPRFPRFHRVLQVLRAPLFEDIPAHAGTPAHRAWNWPKIAAASASIFVVGLAMALTWRFNTTESDPSRLDPPLVIDYVVVAMALAVAALWSSLRAEQLRPDRWPPFLRYLRVCLVLYVLLAIYDPLYRQLAEYGVLRRLDPQLQFTVSPGLAVAVLLIVLSLLGGWLRQLRPTPGDRRRLRSDLLAGALVVAWVAVMNGDDVKMQFDPMSYAPNLRADWGAAVGDYVAWGREGLDPGRHPAWNDPDPSGSAPAPQGLRPTGGRPGEAMPELLDDVAVLERWRAGLWRRTRAPGREDDPVAADFRPKLAVVCVTGGASRAQYWSAVVLDQLGRETPRTRDEGLGFHDGVRLVTGASGGMVGAAYYLAWRDHVRDVEERKARPDDPRADWRADMQTETLPAVASHIALVGLAQALVPRLPEWQNLNVDRGQALELQWSRPVRAWSAWETLARPVSSFRAREAEGLIPSLIFSPVTVDDGRRLLISNLALERLAVNGGDAIGVWTNRREAYSIAALEFFRVFGRQGDPLTLATAARMSGTFPMVSPAVNLPTRPPIRVVDAGYYDNYGVNLAVAWIYQNRPWLIAKTSGVVLVQVRASMGRKERIGPADPTGDAWTNGFQFVTTPFTAFLNARDTTPMFRNDEEVSGLSEAMARDAGRDDFFATVIFENSAQVLLESVEEDPWPGWQATERAEKAAPVTDVAMTWYLSWVEKQSMDRAIPGPEVADRWTLDARGELARADPARPEASFLKDPLVRLRWLDRLRRELRQIADHEADDRLRTFYVKALERARAYDRMGAFYAKEVERALNYERLQALKLWWGRGYAFEGG